MRRTSFAEMECSVARTLEVIGEWWTMLVIREAFSGVRRFDDFQGRLGIARNVLAARLQSLVDHGVLERRQYHDRPPRCEYRLTEKGRDLYPVLIAMLTWGDKWTAGEAGPPLRLTHECGHDPEAILVCSHCGAKLDARQVRAERVRPAAAADAG
ncbi:MAG: transcriptional regulator [Dehalococcoidia bacterium]|jgi:DNA-binding HxlR family transcriptional regulator|nr:helix-turn-helix transcriptional regulator [Dehalococcoidia bacterium]PWB45216.1 MAG: transcriptional regulator [Dehalococcoidia bacterium]